MITSALLAAALFASTPGDAKQQLIRSSTFRGEPGWLVLGDVVRLPREAALRAGERMAQGISATPVPTGYFTNLRPGLIALVYGAFQDKAAAMAFAAAVTAKGAPAYVKQSGALVAKAGKGGPARLMLVWGRLNDTVHHPLEVEVSTDDASVTVSTDRDGWYQAWIPVAAGASGTVELIADVSSSPLPSGRPECTGWFDKNTSQAFGPDTRELLVDWSPSSDCCND